MKISEKSFNLFKVLYVILPFLFGIVPIFYLYSNTFGNSNLFFINLILISFASLALGTLIGFIFGIPKYNKQIEQNNKNEFRKNNFEFNSNLQEISDWVSKIIVGGTLIKIESLPEFLRGIADFIVKENNSIINVKFSIAIIISLIIYFFIYGFIISYLVTILKLQQMLSYKENLKSLVLENSQITSVANNALTINIKTSNEIFNILTSEQKELLLKFKEGKLQISKVKNMDEYSIVISLLRLRIIESLDRDSTSFGTNFQIIDEDLSKFIDNQNVSSK